MPPGKITTYQEWAEQQRAKRAEQEAQGRTERREVERVNASPVPTPTRTPSPTVQPTRTPSPVAAPAPQRGYDPRFDDPNYGRPEKARPTATITPAPLPWRNPQPSPAAVGAILNRTSTITPPYQPPSPPPLGPPPAATPNDRWRPFTPTPPQRSLLPTSRWQPDISHIDQQPEPPPNRPMPTPLGLSAITNPPLPSASFGGTQPLSPTLLSPQPAPAAAPTRQQPLPPLSNNPGTASFQDRQRQYRQLRIEGEDTWPTFIGKTALNLLQASYTVPWGMPLTPADDLSVGQFVAPFGRALFGAGQPEPAPPAQWKPTNDSIYAPRLETFSPAVAFQNMQQYVEDEWAKQNALNQAINALPPDQANAARIATNFFASGAQPQWAGFDLIRQKQQLPQLYAQAQQLVASGKTQEASAAYLYADSLRAKSYTDLAESQSNPAAEFVANIFLDPLNLLDAPIGIALDASRAARAAKAIRALESAAPSSLDNVLVEGQRLLGLTQAGQPAMPARNWLQQLIGRTPETQAHFAADSLLQSASQLYRNVDNANDARIITEAWLNNPRSLVSGLTGLTGDAFRAGADANGVYRFGFGAVAMPDQLKAMPILSLIKDDLLASPALTDASFSPLTWLTAVDNAIYRGARQANGLTALDELPMGASRAAITNKAPQKYAIDYYDAQNNLLGSSPLMSFDAAKQYKANLDNALQAGQKSPLLRGMRGMANIQRAMLSDMWLNLRPTHWIRNATAATAATMADDLYSLRKQADIIADLSTKFAFGAPTERIAGAIGPAAAPAAFDEQRHITRAIWDKGNPLAAASEAGSKIWTGTTEIMGLPFGEQSFYLKAFDRGFNRTFRQAWSGAVDRTLTPLYETLGIAPDVGRQITNKIISSGVDGSRSDMQVAARSAVNGKYMPFDLRQLNIPDELISAEGKRQITRIIDEWYNTTYSPESIRPQVETAIRTAFAQERTRYGDMLVNAPPQPGNYDWTRQDILDTGAEIVDQFTEAARATGGDVAAAEAAGRRLADQVTNAEVNALNSFLEEVKLAPVNADAMNVAFDLLARLHKMKSATRAEVDALARTAVDTLGDKVLRDSAWQRKFAETGRLYSQYAADVQAEITTSLTDLRTVLAGGQVERRYDWWAALNRYFQFDEETNAMQRATVLGSTGDTPRDVWEKTIEANRMYVDQSFVQVYDAFRRFPSLDAMDVLRWAHDNVDDYGARAAAYLAPLRAKAWAKQLDWDKYFAIRNRVWTQVFDNQVIINDLAKRAIVSNGLGEGAQATLRWEDPFAGSIYQLIGPGKTDASGNVITWKAFDIQRRKIEEFANVTGAGSALPDVPKPIIDAYYRVTDQLAKIKPTLDEIASANPLPPAPARLPYTLPEGGSTGRGLPDDWTVNDTGRPGYTPPAPTRTPFTTPGGGSTGRGLPDDWTVNDTGRPIYTPPVRPYGPAEPLPAPIAPEIDFNAIAVGAIPNRTSAPPTTETFDPTARLTKPANWVSTQRTAPLAVGQRVTTPQGPGTITRDANSYYGVKLDSGKTSRFKRSNVQPLTTPTPAEAAQGQQIAQAAAPPVVEGGLSGAVQRATDAAERVTNLQDTWTQLRQLVRSSPGSDRMTVEFATQKYTNRPIVRITDERAIANQQSTMIAGFLDDPSEIARVEETIAARNAAYGQPSAPITRGTPLLSRPMELGKRFDGDTTWAQWLDQNRVAMKEVLPDAKNKPTYLLRLDNGESYAAPKKIYDAVDAVVYTPPPVTEIPGVNGYMLKQQPSAVETWEIFDPYSGKVVQSVRGNSEKAVRAAWKLPTAQYTPPVVAQAAPEAARVATPSPYLSYGPPEPNQNLSAPWRKRLDQTAVELAELRNRLKHKTIKYDSKEADQLRRFGLTNEKASKRALTSTESEEFQRLLTEEIDRIYARKALPPMEVSAPLEVRESTGKTNRFGLTDRQTEYLQSELPKAVDALRSGTTPYYSIDLGDQTVGLDRADFAASLYRTIFGKPMAGFEETKGMSVFGKADIPQYEGLPRPTSKTPQDAFEKYGTKGQDTLFEGDQQLFAVAPGTVEFQKALGFFQEEIWQNLVRYWGKQKQPEVGDVARHMIRTLNDAEDSIINALPGLAQQPPNALNQAARNAIISAVDRLGPTFDNAVAVSRQAAQDLADGAMLNYNDRRGFDQILSLVFPYHYYWTRGGLNWAKRLARKPSYLNLIQEVNRFQDNRQQQLDTPQRMDSYIPVGKFGDTVLGVANPLNWILPRYMPNEFVDPEDARSQAERYWLMIQQSTPGVLPLLAYGADAFFDWQSGATGKDRKATANLRQFVPAAGIAADAYQAATGKVSPPGIAPGDPWDPYRVRTTLAVMAQEKAIDPATAQYAQQIAYNLETGKDRYTGIPPAAKTSADAAYTQAAQRSGGQRLLSTASNYLLGSSIAAAPQAEIDLRKQQRDYNAAGYNPATNPYGSNALRRDILDANPALPTMWTRNATESNQPAPSAQRSERWEALTNAVFDPMNQAVTEAIRRNPAATPAQIAAVKAPFYARIDAINARFPLAAGSGSSRPPSGATPSERALYELQRIVESAGGTPPPWPGDDATPGQLATYRQQKDAYDQRKLSAIESNLSQLLRQVESDPSQPWQSELASLVRGQYAMDIKRNYDDLAYAQPTEKAWAEEAYFKRAASNAQWQDKQKQVAKRVGAAAIPQWAAYHQADDATRTAMREDPAIREMLMAGYNPAQYDAAIVEFGPNAWDTYFDPNYPKYPENPTQDQLTAYYAQRDAYEAAHPRSAELRFWLNGRYRWSDQASSPVEFYDFGKDWKEAQRVFGPNIFDIERQANAAPDYGAWARSHQQQADLLAGFRQWKSALSDVPTSRNQLPTLNLAATPRQPQQLSSQPFRTTYTGPDPYAAMSPIGADPMPRTPTAPYTPPTPPAIPPAAPPAVPPAAPPAMSPAAPQSAIYNPQSPLPTAQPWRSPTQLPAPTAAPLDEPITDPYTGLTAQQWAARDPKYIQRQARLDQVQQTFGAEGLQQFSEYANLPADSPQRDEYRRLHPQITLINMAAYDGANYNNLVEMFGQDALNAWANTPAWGESEAEQNTRKEYLDANPIAWLVDAYVDGRPTPYDPSAPQRTERNHGADWALAEQQFGADIWQRIAAYRGADSGTRRAMRDADPAIMQFFDWWYAALPDTGAGGGRPVPTYRSADGLVTYDQYGRRLDSNGNVARGFYPSSGGGGGGSGGGWRSYPPEVRPRYMDERLWYASDLRAWRPPDNDINMNWLNAGSRVGPDRIIPWRAPN